MAYTTIKKPSDYFNTVLYTGDDSSNRGITGVGFQPDLVWNKTRNQANFNHYIFDSVRGAGEIISSNLTNAETSYTSEFLSLDSDGFSVTQNAGSLGINWSSGNYVNWCWLGANGTASNTDGSITSTVSANTTSGFSIVSYTGTGSSISVGHGLSQKPDIVIFKNRDAVVNWGVYTDLIDGSYDFLYLNQTNAKADSGSYSASANTFSFSASSTVANTSGEKVIAYCFHNVKGFSKFGSYTGNGNADGSFIYTGFKPAWVMIKRSNSAGEGWHIYDNKRNTFNLVTQILTAHNSNAEATGSAGGDVIDMLSQGFKCRGTHGAINGSGNSYIYMAFAEEPLVGDNPATAR
jgi:hypothetical protein